MDTVTLCRLACSDRKIRKTFGGVYASDSLPFENKIQSSAFIVNLDPHSMPGSHWVAIYFKQDNQTAYYFDSYGMPPSNKNILDFLQNNTNTIVYNKVCFQHNMSFYCGYFCLYFLFCCAREMFDMALLNRRDKKKNDIIIRRFARQTFKPGKCCYFSYYKKQNCTAMINVLRFSKNNHY